MSISNESKKILREEIKDLNKKVQEVNGDINEIDAVIARVDKDLLGDQKTRDGHIGTRLNFLNKKDEIQNEIINIDADINA